MILAILKMIGCLALLMFGMKTMSEGLQKLTGGHLRTVLGTMTKHRLGGLLTGTAVTAAVQSSTATTVMTVSFVNAGLLTLRQAILVIMGANIGTTATAWLMSIFGFQFNMSNVVWPFFALGIVLTYVRKNSVKSFGEFVFGFSFMFLGLTTLRENAVAMDLSHNQTIIDFFASTGGYGIWSTLLFLLLGGILTMCGSTEAHALASKPIRYVFGDERDRWATSAGNEGDPWDLAMARQTTFYNSMAFEVSTPTIKNASAIEAAYSTGTMERWKSRCPHCGEYHEIQWADIRFEYDENVVAGKKTYRFEGGIGMRSSMNFMDEGGHFTMEVRQHCAARLSKKLFCIKGMPGQDKPYTAPPKKQKIMIRNVAVGTAWQYQLGVDSGKEIIMDNLKVQTPGPKYCHFPRRDDYGGGYFKGLLSEVKVYDPNKKQPWTWKKIPGHERNEALDCRNYALAAFKALPANLDEIDRRLKAAKQNPAAAPSAPAAQAAAPRKKKKGRSQKLQYDEW